MKAFVRAFALAPDCHAAGRYMRLWRHHFYDGLQAALPSVVLPVGVDFGWARPASAATLGPSRDRSAVSGRLWDQIRAAHAERGLDAVISYCFSSDVDPALIERTVALGIPWINFFCDSTYAFDLVEALARVASLNWFPELAADARYRALGRPVLCRPYAVHPAALPEAICQTAEHMLGFVGAPTGNRVLRLAGLRLFGCLTEVRGEGWKRTNAAPPPRRLSHRPCGLWVSHAPAHQRRCLGQVPEGQHFSPYLEGVLDVLVVLGQVAAAVTGELHVAQLEVAPVDALTIAALVQPQHYPTAREKGHHLVVRKRTAPSSDQRRERAHQDAFAQRPARAAVEA